MMSRSDRKEYMDPEVEVGLGRKVRATEAELSEVVGEARIEVVEASRVGRGNQSSQSRSPEDAARGLVDAEQVIGRAREALTRYQSAVNALWSEAVSVGYPERLVSGWRMDSRHGRRYARLRLDRADLEAEAVMALREAVSKFDPDKGRFLPHARWVVYRRLDEWAGQQGSPVELPKPIAAENTVDRRVEFRETGSGSDE